MKISLIGAGNIGACLARKLKDVRHTVRIANSAAPRLSPTWRRRSARRRCRSSKSPSSQTC
jgi:predicted dinucleotide-binding enzyme